MPEILGVCDDSTNPHEKNKWGNCANWRPLSAPVVQSAEDRWNLKQELAAPSRYYGDGGTIHSTGQLDVGVDRQGRVVAVWFRCQLLPFEQYDADDDRGVGRGNPDIQLTGVEVLDG
jgi:hypothetical protein